LSNKVFRYAVYALVSLAAFGAGIWLSGSRRVESPPQQAAASDVLYSLRLPDLEGKPQTLEQWRNKVLVVNFWATWCAPCREEIPIFVKMQEKSRDKGLQFVGISIDQADKTSEFARNFGINYPILIGTFDTIEISRQAGNKQRVLPYTVILDRQGRIVATELGGLTREKIEAIISPLL
jgi:thiol-disulfide isomerase/thioredoxin